MSLRWSFILLTLLLAIFTASTSDAGGATRSSSRTTAPVAATPGDGVRWRLSANGDEQICQFFRAVRSLAESRLAEVEQVTHAYLTKRGAMEAVKGDEPTA